MTDYIFFLGQIAFFFLALVSLMLSFLLNLCDKPNYYIVNLLAESKQLMNIFVIIDLVLINLSISHRCVGVREYQAVDIDRFHCPRCEAYNGPSVCMLLNLQINIFF